MILNTDMEFRFIYQEKIIKQHLEMVLEVYQIHFIKELKGIILMEKEKFHLQVITLFSAAAVFV